MGTNLRAAEELLGGARCWMGPDVASEEESGFENIRMDSRWFHSQTKVQGRAVLEGKVDARVMSPFN